MNLILIGKGSILFAIALEIQKYSDLNLKKILWDNKSNNKNDLYFYKNLKNRFNIYKINDINHPKNKKIIDNDIDYILSVNNTQIFDKQLVKKFQRKIINYHYSLIPSYKGLYSCTKVIMKNEKFTGITWHVVTNKIDNGPIIFQKKIVINKNDNAAKLIMKLNYKCIDTLPIFIKNLKKMNFKKTPKNTKDFSINLKKNNFQIINFGMSSEKILRLFRAFDYFPFRSPLPNLKIHLNKYHEIKDIKIVRKPVKKFNNFLRINAKEFVIKTLDRKYLKVNVV